MRIYLALISALFFGVAVAPSWASFTVALDAGQLRSPASAAMQADNTSPSNNGSLIMLIDLGSSRAINNTLTPGNYVSGTNTILAVGGFNNNGGTNETLTVLTSEGTPNAGDQIALRWFPQITYAQYRAGAVPTAGEYFGSYDPAGGNPDGNSPWTVPSDGTQISLNFFTSDTGGSQPPAIGFAGFEVTASGQVPFSAWQSIFFTTQQLNAPATSGASATPQHDGVTNLLKYLFQIDPILPMSAADRAALPAVQETDTGSVLTLTYRQNPAVTGITVTAQTSTDLQTWSTVPTQQVSTDPTTGDFIMQARVDPAGARQFLRLDISSP